MTLYKNLVPLDVFIENEPIKIDLAYQNADHPRNIFKTKIYHKDARCWAHKDLATITIATARHINKHHGWILEIKDCLRTYDSQEAMEKTDIVKANPQWMEQPRLLAPPGAGAHPRAMAIDVCALYSDGSQVNMGTPFDWMDEKSARDYKDFHQDILTNRSILEDAFVQCANALKQDFIPYPAEWWDYRYSNEFYTQFAPLSDANLPPQMQMTNKIDNNIENLPPSHFEKLAEEITSLLNTMNEDL